MEDISWNFTTNDIDIVGGDFATTLICARQNATLIFMKQAVSLQNPNVGVSFETRYANIKLDYAQLLADRARQQVLADGARKCVISINQDETGMFNFKVEADYNE